MLNEKYTHQYYSSLEHLHNACKQAAEKQKTAWVQGHFLNQRNEFNGVGYSEAVEMLFDGWAEGTSRMAKNLEALEAKKPGNAPTRRFDVAGYAPCVPMFCANSPVCMYSNGPDMRATKQVMSIFINRSVSACVTQETVHNFAAALLGTIENLEEQGFSVELLIGIKSSVAYVDSQQKYSGIVVRAKGPEESLQTAALAYLLGHVSVLRRIGFGLCSVDDRFSYLGYTLGYPADPPADFLPPGTMIVPTIGSREFSSPEQAFTFIQNNLNPQLAERA